ncbi:MAG: radical SAM protein, partial [Syntrophales bacterium LBB04]|nr:radical SAM protein [Syntrophales bacterium LBB04]
MKASMPPLPENMRRAGLYLHIPFCRNLCPYCPYNRINYDEDLFNKFENAVLEEINIYAQSLTHCNFISLYIGGGTPTINMPGLIRILNHLKNTFKLSCDISIELHPSNMDNECLKELKGLGVTMLSIGVESTSDHVLKSIGRNHDGKTALNALQRAKETGFDSINADLMFALPDQTLTDWENDVRNVLNEGVDQISTYPLFSFPYSDLGKEQHISTIKRPAHDIVKKMLTIT